MTTPDPSPTIPSYSRRAIVVFALLGLVSGVLSWIGGSYLGQDWLRFSFVPFGWREGAPPIAPGIVFGLLVAACCHHYGSKNKLDLVFAVLITTAAWILAYDLTVLADEKIGSLRKTTDIIDVLAGGAAGGRGSSTQNGFVLGTALSFGLGGLIGGIGTALAAALAHPRMRRPPAFVLTVVVGTVFGAIEKVYDLLGDAGLLVLFMCWQAAVIASVARGLARG
jgi:hypothetical protein